MHLAWTKSLWLPQKLCGESGDVLKERHPPSITEKIFTPSAKWSQNLTWGQEVIDGGSESPAERWRENLDNIRKFWVGKDRVSSEKNISMCLKNATHTASKSDHNL